MNAKRTTISRILFILNYLMKETDADSSVSVNELIEICKDNGYDAPKRQTVTDYILELQDAGFPVLEKQADRTKEYYFGNHLTAMELRAVIDSII